MSYHFGAVGQGLPLAIGTGAGNPGRPHVAIEGDGSLLFHIQELDTVTRYKMQMVLIVWNDGGYGAEVHKLNVKGFDRGQAQWRFAGFRRDRESFWRRRREAEEESELPAAVAEGLRKGGLYLDRCPGVADHSQRSVRQGALRHPETRRRCCVRSRNGQCISRASSAYPARRADAIMRRFADVPRMARCMPGAVLEPQAEDGS